MLYGSWKASVGLLVLRFNNISYFPLNNYHYSFTFRMGFDSFGWGMWCQWEKMDREGKYSIKIFYNRTPPIEKLVHAAHTHTHTHTHNHQCTIYIFVLLY